MEKYLARFNDPGYTIRGLRLDLEKEGRPESEIRTIIGYVDDFYTPSVV